jgi:hypothetical protein
MNNRQLLLIAILIFTALLCSLSGCDKEGSLDMVDVAIPQAPAGSTSRDLGSLVFTANGEDFVRHGFVDKTGWAISFESLYINIAMPTAYIPGDERQVVLEGEHWVDLAAGGKEAQPIVLGWVEGVSPANYQALRFALKRVSDGPYTGASIVMIGSAEREGRRVPFTIRLDEEMLFDGRDGYVGEELKGLLQPGSSTQVEMTFHFDHLFGDMRAEKDDHINQASVGFEFFYAFAKGGVVDVSQAQLKGAEGYRTLVQALWTLGHLGEGHCEVSEQSSKDLLRSKDLL